MQNTGEINSDGALLVAAVAELTAQGVQLPEAMQMAAEIFPDPLGTLQQIYDAQQEVFEQEAFAAAVECAFERIKRELQEEQQLRIEEVSRKLAAHDSLEARADFLVKRIEQRRFDRALIDQSIDQLRQVLDDAPALEDERQMEQRVTDMQRALGQYDRAIEAARAVIQRNAAADQPDL